MAKNRRGGKDPPRAEVSKKEEEVQGYLITAKFDNN
jgi:hypothetical protein